MPASLLFCFILFHTIFISSHILLGELITLTLCLCGLSSARMFKTLIAFCRRNAEALWIVFAATGRGTKISTNNNDIVCCNISYRLISFNLLSTRSNPNLYSTHLNQEHIIIKDLQQGALFTLTIVRKRGKMVCIRAHHTHHTHTHACKSDNRSEWSKWNSLGLWITCLAWSEKIHTAHVPLLCALKERRVKVAKLLFYIDLEFICVCEGLPKGNSESSFKYVGK